MSTWRGRTAIATELGGRLPLHLVPLPGSAAPRLGPPKPKASLKTELRNAAQVAEVQMMEWQDIAGSYMTATTKGKRWLYPEVCIVVARQNGKSTLLIPRIVMGLLRGEKIMHTAQNRELPRQIYHQVAGIMETKFKPLMAHNPRYANGQELITMRDGGMYRIVAPNTSGARGYPNDLVIVDEARELNDFDFVGAARPTLTASRNAQMVYLSNAGDEASTVLNSLRKRSESDPQLAYLEWSAHPDKAADDTAGWAEANPALGSTIELSTLQTAYQQLPLPVFETEHLCRWVTTMLPRLVSDIAWQRARHELPKPIRPHMGIAVDSAGRRVSCVIAWMDDGLIYVHLLADFDDAPVNLEDRAAEVLPLMRKLGIRQVAYDPWADRDFARFFKDAKQISAQDYTAASQRFKGAIEGGQLRHDDNAEITADMNYTVQRETGHGMVAVPATSERATTASLAAIRAVWLATQPAPKTPRVF